MSGGPADAFVPAPPAMEWVGDWSRRRARLSPDRVGLVDATTGREFTYAELDARANRTARLCRSLGVEKGDRVVTLSRNRPELVDLFFATGKLGAVLAPLSHRLAPPTLAELLTDVAPTALVVERPFAELARDVLAHEACGVSPTVLVVSDESSDASDGESGDTSETATESALDASDWHDRLPADDGAIERPQVGMDDPHLFLHTGGSTGTPKETVIPHRSILWNSFNTITAWGLQPTDTTPMTFPMFHTGGWNVITVPLFHLGGQVVIAREVDPGQLLETISEREATVLVAVPAVLRVMTDHERWADTSLDSLRFVKSGGGPARSSVMEAWWDRGVELSQGYGLTECGPNNFAMPDDWPREKAGSVGVPAMHVDARVVDDDGEPLDTGEIGELELSGPHAADRYWRAPAESRATFGPERDGKPAADDSATDTGDSWVSTGDLARIDADGYYHIEGRKKNMFTSGGENVYPPEVEDALTDHPDVDEAVVIGVPDDQWGTVGKAVVVGDESLTLSALREFLDGRLARFKHPRELAFTDEMPTAGPSKIDRTAIEAEFGRDE